MNVFTTDHPMVSQPARSHPRLRRWLLGGVFIYPVWLLLLGPFWALDGPGAIDFLPFSVRRGVYLPTAPFCYSPGLYSVFEGYMNWWYEDPNAPETTL